MEIKSTSKTLLFSCKELKRWTRHKIKTSLQIFLYFLWKYSGFKQETLSKHKAFFYEIGGAENFATVEFKSSGI